MSTKRDLGVVDRGTLRFWRVANVVGWSLGALLVGAALSFLMSVLFVDILDALMDGVVPGWIQVLTTSLVGGAAMGAVIGSRVYRWPAVVAVAVCIVFLYVLPISFMLPLWLSNRALGYALSALVVPSAVAVAVYRYRKRSPAHGDDQRQKAGVGRRS
jgi:hypothetical protein